MFRGVPPVDMQLHDSVTTYTLVQIQLMSDYYIVSVLCEQYNVMLTDLLTSDESC